MIKTAGVYTTKCPKCTRSILIHVSSDGSISPNKCKECSIEFECIEHGEERNTFVVVVKTEKSKAVVNDGTEDIAKEKKIGEEKKVVAKGKKPKESFKMWG
jgi:hypothetical protein